MKEGHLLLRVLPALANDIRFYPIIYFSTGTKPTKHLHSILPVIRLSWIDQLYKLFSSLMMTVGITFFPISKTLKTH